MIEIERGEPWEFVRRGLRSPPCLPPPAPPPRRRSSTSASARRTRPPTRSPPASSSASSSCSRSTCPRTASTPTSSFELDWNNFTSGPPVTNGMMANKLQFGAMGDYPLVVNGFTFQSNPESKSQLVAVAAYNIHGSGNGLVVHKDSSYYQLSDLKGKVVSVPFGSAAHGMMLKAMQDRGWPADYFQPGEPEPGSRLHQPAGKEDRRARRLRAVRRAAALPRLRAQDLRRRRDQRCRPGTASWCAPTSPRNIRRSWSPTSRPSSRPTRGCAPIPRPRRRRSPEWTGIDKEVVYIFLGPGGIMTIDPTIKPSS